MLVTKYVKIMKTWLIVYYLKKIAVGEADMNKTIAMQSMKTAQSGILRDIVRVPKG